MEKTDVVVVGGAGHVGLPFANVLAAEGLSVIAYDIDHVAVNSINQGVATFEEPGLNLMLANNLANQNFSASIDPNVISGAEYVVIVFGTPVDEFLSANPVAVINQIKGLVKYFRSGQHLILRSTIYPGLSRKIQQLMIEERLDIDVIYCPERITEGNAILEIRTLPQIVGTKSGIEKNIPLGPFKSLGIEFVQVTYEEAELAKLFSNAWRYITFATANTFFATAESMDANFGNIRNAMQYKYPRAQSLPGPGFAAGPCLPKDTMQLQSLMGGNFGLGAAAYEVNENLPNFLVEKIKEKVNLSDTNIAILGLSFKGNVDDQRSSLAHKLRKILEFESKSVRFVEPFLPDYKQSELNDVVAWADLLVIGAPHDIFKELNTFKPIIDVWNLFETGQLYIPGGGLS